MARRQPDLSRGVPGSGFARLVSQEVLNISHQAVRVVIRFLVEVNLQALDILSRVLVFGNQVADLSLVGGRSYFQVGAGDGRARAALGEGALDT